MFIHVNTCSIHVSIFDQKISLLSKISTKRAYLMIHNGFFLENVLISCLFRAYFIVSCLFRAYFVLISCCFYPFVFKKMLLPLLPALFS